MDDLKRAIESGAGEIHVNHLSGAARAFFLSSLLTDLERPCLLVLPSAKDAARFYRELVFFLPGALTGPLPEQRRLYDFPVYDISPLAGLSPHRDVISRRLQALYVLISGKNPIVVTSVETLLLKIMPKATMIQSIELLEPEEEFDREDLLRKLEANGYSRTSLVEERGDYSVRGGVIDIFPPLYPQPVRLEFWGDRLESIRHFETLSQRSTEPLKECVLLPSSEIVMDSAALTRARSMGRIPIPPEGGTFPGQEAWLNHFYSRPDTVFDYLPKEGLLIRLDPHRMEREAKKFAEKFLKDTEKYREGAFERDRPFPELENILSSYEDMTPLFQARRRIDFSELPVGEGDEGAVVLNIEGVSGVDDGLDIRMAGRGKISMAPLADRVSGWLRSGSRVVLVCRTEQQAQRLKEILDNYRVEVNEVVEGWHEVKGGNGLSICLGRLTRGFSWPETGIHLISEDEIFGPKRARSRSKKGLEGEGPAWTGLS